MTLNANEALRAASALYVLRHFIGYDQKHVLRELWNGEEGEHFLTVLEEYAARIATMPKVYEQDGLEDQAVAHLHYFIGGCDWHITERDTSKEQHQAFGWANLGYGPELGYISIAEIIKHGAEIDLYWKPATLAAIKQKAA